MEGILVRGVAAPEGCAVRGYISAKLAPEFAQDPIAVEKIRSDVWNKAQDEHLELGLLVITELPSGEVEFAWPVSA